MVCVCVCVYVCLPAGYNRVVSVVSLCNFQPHFHHLLIPDNHSTNTIRTIIITSVGYILYWKLHFASLGIIHIKRTPLLKSQQKG